MGASFSLSREQIKNMEGGENRIRHMVLNWNWRNQCEHMGFNRDMDIEKWMKKYASICGGKYLYLITTFFCWAAL